jgi:hypothetical protein
MTASDEGPTTEAPAAEQDANGDAEAIDEDNRPLIHRDVAGFRGWERSPQSTRSNEKVSG